MKRIVTLLIIIALVISATPTETNAKSKLSVYRQKAKRIEINQGFHATDCADCVDEYWTHKGRVFVERIIGKVKDNNGNGKVLNLPKDDNGKYDYISYANVNANKGDIVVTYLLYNPETNGDDDIIARWDYIIVHKAK
jgi:hypothetical protein